MPRPNRTPRNLQRYDVRRPKELVRRGAQDVERGLQDTECRGKDKPAHCPPAPARRTRGASR
jgi:hypothetical protein